ncbi:MULTISPECIES: type II toxin-antitoxin system RelB/DinJ family antitoxin [Selenomonas]|uniref:Type II toxin-antitoxin system RelB/DinJ family antitoxin n=1 Tax=Selenomonas timonae TaxID=2754044 RepID=A0A7G7VLR8_9FIRM|nr:MULTISPECIES: type II toxin-antitoxin system RelB/DinJ family antitoxin [Selenomonas]EKX97223.1 addiction module antitoxin, RelB/DinJ family [Selenomonas sp. oral taxon 138 str. F0429]QNH55061.1 type II toxin-antitoxin system RelB/DinJ family antitoxin [Selenomonas timonae]
MEQAVNVNFRLDAAVKKNMEQVCAELGLSMSAAFTIFAKKVGRERRIPFDVSIDPFYDERNLRYLEQKMADYKAGKLRFVEHDLIED